MKLLITILALLLFILHIAVAQTIVTEGEVTGIWQFSESPIIIEGNIVVPEGGKLTIDPGVEVLFSGPYIFEIYGRVDATGTVEDSIYFGMTDTTGFSTNNYEGWGGIAFMNPPTNVQEASMLDFVNVEFSNSSAITCYNMGLSIKNSKIKNNKGFGLYLVDATEISVENTIISYNLSGGIISHSSAPVISNFLVSHNGGTGILATGNTFNNEQVIFQNGIIRNNTSNSSGGGVYVGMDANIHMVDISVVSNSALYGGGICCEMGFIELENSEVSFNEAEYGGGLYISGWSNVFVNSTLIADNEAYQSGGAIWISNSNVDIYQSTLAFNMAGETGAGIEYEMIENKVNTINNSILWANFPQEIITFDAQPEIQYSDVMGGYNGYEVLNADPLFVDAENNNYHLQWDSYPSESGFKSPAIDSGDPSGDYDPDGTIADLGAFYFEQTIFTHTHAMNRNFELSIFPNPVSESFSIMANQEISKIEIINLTGQVIQVVENIDLNLKVNISDFNKGIYLLNIYFKNSEVGTGTLIKN